MMSYSRLCLFILTLILSSCASVGNLKVSDPYQKLAQAEYMYEVQRLRGAPYWTIMEAKEIFQEMGDLQGLAEVYRSEAFYYMNPRNNRKKDYEIVIELLETSAKLFKHLEMHDMLTNIYINMGNTYSFLKKNTLACESYDTSAYYAEKYKNLYPREKIILPEGYTTYNEYIKEVKLDNKCTVDDGES